MRTTLFTALALIVGFGLGWASRSATRITLSDEAKSAVSLTSATVPTISTPAPVPPPNPGPAEMDRSDIFGNRVATLRWLRQSGAPVNLRAFSGDKFTPALGKILGVTPDETNRLNNAALEAKRTLDAARLTRASSHPGEDGKTLIVDVPPIDTATSRAIYEGLLDTLKATLGSERYGVFNELTGDSFEAIFDQFGLNTLRYELVLQPQTPAGNLPYLEYKRHYVDPTGVSKGWSGSTLSVAQIEKNDPILAHFIPPHLRATEAK